MSTREADILAAIARRLQQSSYQGLKHLSYEIAGDVLILQGRVSTFHEKQLAQEVFRDIRSVRQIVNEVTVDSSTRALERPKDEPTA